MKSLFLSALLTALGPLISSADEYTDLVASFGSTLTLTGTLHSDTTNPDGTAINFWNSSYEGASAKTASLSNPHMAMADAYGNIYIADKASHSILKIAADGAIHTFAGTHQPGFNGDGPAPATTLQISQPNGLFALPNGTVYLLDPGNHRIRRVGRDGLMSTVVNDPDPQWASSGRGLWVSPDESVVYYSNEIAPSSPGAETQGAVINRWTPGAGIETICSQAVGFRNPANLDVNPVDGKLYVTDRAEDDTTGKAAGLFRIDGLDQRTRVTGNSSQNDASEGRLASKSYIAQPRGIAFRADGSYFICGHQDGNVWFVDTVGVLHKYLNGSGTGDDYDLQDGKHPPFSKNHFAQPRSVTLAPNGNLLVVSNDSGFVFQVGTASPTLAVSDARVSLNGVDVLLSWTGLFKRGYRVQSSIDLGSWRDVGAVNGTGGATSFRDLHAATEQARFYRILPAL